MVTTVGDSLKIATYPRNGGGPSLPDNPPLVAEGEPVAGTTDSSAPKAGPPEPAPAPQADR